MPYAPQGVKGLDGGDDDDDDDDDEFWMSRNKPFESSLHNFIGATSVDLPLTSS